MPNLCFFKDLVYFFILTKYCWLYLLALLLSHINQKCYFENDRKTYPILKYRVIMNAFITYRVKINWVFTDV